MTHLLLFDIDGTLLSTNGAARRAFHAALLHVFGTTGPIDSHRFDGKTDPQIARELLNLAGLRDAEIDPRLPALWEAYLANLARELASPAHSSTTYPGVVELVAALARRDDVLLALLTGNIAEGAALKLSSVGLHEPFRFGAFGSDHEDRGALPAIAVDRAEAIARKRFTGREIVVIGDTPNDVTCGRSLGVRAIGVCTGNYDRRSLVDAGAERVFDDFADTAAVLEYLLATDSPRGSA